MRRFFHACARSVPGAPVGDSPYAEWHAWSVREPAAFWAAWWRAAELVADERPGHDPWDEIVDHPRAMRPPGADGGPHWFRGARLNFAENVLCHRGAAPAIIARDETGARRALSHDDLIAEVAAVAAALAASGVVAGDRVAGFLPNVPETVIAALAAASIGAVWSSCSPDFGVDGVLDRFGQIAPRVLVVADGYRYAGKEIDTLPRVREIVQALPTVEQVVVVPHFARGFAGAEARTDGVPRAVSWRAFVARGAGAAPSYVRLPFDHPLYIMYSSGTTGLPKCLVHGAGGTLLQHLKEHRLHCDLRPGDRFFYFTTCGWMMWNWLLTGLASGAAIVLYDGAPMPAAEPDALWRLAAEERVAIFGASAKFLALCEKGGLRPAQTHALDRLQTILSTGSPLAPAGFDYIAREVGAHVHLASISGGTDLLSCFALGNPLLPVYRGELQCLGLGMDVDVVDDDGRPVHEAPGELVCRTPFPSMPIAFWDDPGDAKYRAAYFEQIDGLWRHGDWAERTAHGGLVIHGRSDATLNPGGVRIGTAEIYRQVEQCDEVLESIVIGQEIGAAEDRDVRVVLFVRLRAGHVLDDALEQRIRGAIRTATSPHHVPRVIVAVDDIPRTVSGKITELAVRDVVHGRVVRNTSALANPDALAHFADRPELRIPS
jgi:acetoacetyl-CoA synthetase